MSGDQSASCFSQVSSSGIRDPNEGLSTTSPCRTGSGSPAGVLRDPCARSSGDQVASHSVGYFAASSDALSALVSGDPVASRCAGSAAASSDALAAHGVSESLPVTASSDAQCALGAGVVAASSDALGALGVSESLAVTASSGELGALGAVAGISSGVPLR